MGKTGYLISVLNNVNKQAGRLTAWSTQGHSFKPILWEFPQEQHNYWIKIKHHFTTKWETKIDSITWRETQWLQGIPCLCECFRRASEKGCCTDILQLSPAAIQTTLYRSFTWSVCHICAQRSQLRPKSDSERVHTWKNKPSYIFSSQCLKNTAKVWSHREVYTFKL